MEGKKKISKSRIFFILSLSFLLGVLGASFFDLKSFSVLTLLAFATGTYILFRENPKVVMFSAAIFFLALGIWRANASLESARKKILEEKTGPVEIFGIVVREPEKSEKNQKIILKNEHSEGGIEKILVNMDLFSNYSIGDLLKVKCVLEKPKKYPDSGFDYGMYLAKDGISRICNRADVEIVSKKKGFSPFAAVIGVKDRFENVLSRVFPDPEGAYLKGLLLGGSKRLPEKISDAFSKTGTTHTVAVSGYNVTIVAASLMWFGIAFGLWRQQIFSFALIGIVLFVVATGAPSSAVRAGIMGALVIWAMKEGRLANSQNAILFAASMMLAVNPLLLRYDAGFQLSFLATLGIVWIYPLFEKKFFGREQNILKETVLMTLAAQIFVLPVILSNFETLSVISPLANLVILPAVPYIMLGGFAAGIAGIIFVPLGKLVGFVPYIFLKAELEIVQFLANLSWASVEIKNFGWIQILIYYIILAGILYFFSKRKPAEAGE